MMRRHGARKEFNSAVVWSVWRGPTGFALAEHLDEILINLWNGGSVSDFRALYRGGNNSELENAQTILNTGFELVQYFSVQP